jgi:hypothetical protein
MRSHPSCAPARYVAVAEAAVAELVRTPRAGHVRATALAKDAERALRAAARDGVDQLLARPAGARLLVVGARDAIVRVALAR